MGGRGVFGEEPFEIFEALSETREEAVLNFHLARSRQQWAAEHSGNAGGMQWEH